MTFDAGPRTRFEFSVFSHHSDSVNADFAAIGQDVYEGFTMETLYGKADLRTSFADNVDLSLSAWRLRNDDNFYQRQLGTDVTTRDAPTLFDRSGITGSLVWRTAGHTVVAGADVSHSSFDLAFEPGNAIEQSKYALFLNDTATVGNLTVTPGLRYDHSGLAGGTASPSLGVTYLAAPDLLFRALVSRGFHDPAVVKYLDAPPFGYYAPRELGPEKIWSYQAGVEANVDNLLRAKLTLFYHDIDDILVEKSLSATTSTTENGGSARTAGGEFGLATNPYAGFVFDSGVHYERMRLVDFSDPKSRSLRDVYGVNAALSYGGDHGFRMTLKSHYLWWDASELMQADSGGVVVDLVIAKRFPVTGKVALTLFADAHNLFNASSYNDVFHKNPGRWLEAGVRCTF